MVELILHELRTPLNVASGSLAQASDERIGVLSTAQRAHIERARRACATLEQVVRQLRDWTELVNRTPGAHTLLGPAVQEAVLQAVEATGRGVEAPVTMAGDVTVPVAPVALREALQSLVAAVLRASSDRASVPVGMQPLAADASSRQRIVRISIGELGASTSGSGFEAEWLGGLGFSLPLARAIVESAGGAVWSHQPLGRLTGIGIELPARSQS
jgi:signal transduction histidine kinase